MAAPEVSDRERRDAAAATGAMPAGTRVGCAGALSVLVLLTATCLTLFAAGIGPPVLAYTLVSVLTGDAHFVPGRQSFIVGALVFAILLGGSGLLVGIALRRAQRPDAPARGWLLAGALLLPLLAVAFALAALQSLTPVSGLILVTLAALAVAGAAVVRLGRSDATAAAVTNALPLDPFLPDPRPALVVVGAYTLVSCLVLGALNYPRFKRDLLTVDFETTSTPFPDGDLVNARATTSDGAYVMTQTKPGSVTAVSIGDFFATADIADATVDVLPTRPGRPAPTAIGIGCGAATDPASTALLLTSPDGTHVTLALRWGDTGTLEVLETAHTDQPVTNLRLTCEPRSELLQGSSVRLTGYINGNLAIKTGTRWADSIDSIALAFQGDHAGTEARFDNVQARRS